MYACHSPGLARHTTEVFYDVYRAPRAAPMAPVRMDRGVSADHVIFPQPKDGYVELGELARCFLKAQHTPAPRPFPVHVTSHSPEAPASTQQFHCLRLGVADSTGRPFCDPLCPSWYGAQTNPAHPAATAVSHSPALPHGLSLTAWRSTCAGALRHPCSWRWTAPQGRRSPSSTSRATRWTRRPSFGRCAPARRQFSGGRRVCEPSATASRATAACVDSLSADLHFACVHVFSHIAATTGRRCSDAVHAVTIYGFAGALSGSPCPLRSC